MSTLNTGSKSGLPATQLLRYAVVGLISNSCGYALYLLLTEFGTTPKVTMSTIYACGALIGFFGNRKLTFSHEGGLLGSGSRFVIAQLGGYAINFLLLDVLVDRLGYPHQWVQASAIVIVAIYLFVTLKFFVFKAIP
ncbi:GtrA family protein [Pseudomonas sp. 14P_8.1_Bac3]|uniref:GtrA family protein n=1 Tax=Pseudomonas sp. 14P_8.1_Bac3 TaxID=2971621 RepID=UPI0021C9C2C0|nr:GtrA family protein [Pseudomonas sp. 14P_8.1_Bac3]MCU1762152.1 GtrA family protein [Pseudomonas sp. 14P_8.1_Bac3]